MESGVGNHARQIWNTRARALVESFQFSIKAFLFASETKGNAVKQTTIKTHTLRWLLLTPLFTECKIYGNSVHGPQIEACDCYGWQYFRGLGSIQIKLLKLSSDMILRLASEHDWKSQFRNLINSLDSRKSYCLHSYGLWLRYDANPFHSTFI